MILAAFLALGLLLFAVVVDIGKVWLTVGEIQRALDASALAGANTMTVYVYVDKYGTVYSYEVESDPVRAYADAHDTFMVNTSGLQGINILRLDITIEGSKVTMTTEFEVLTSLLSAFGSIPPKVQLTRRASAVCTVVPEEP